MRRLAAVILALVAASVVTLGVTSCKQGLGDRCQVESDCSSGLICNQATGTCQSSTSGADGNIMPDARQDAGPDAEADADPADAAVDAEIDATIL
jgi:hypothetical protein